MSNEEIFTSYYFAVEIDGIQGAMFKSCNGLEIKTDVFELEEGGYNLSTRKFIGKTHFQNIVLEHGITKRNNDLYNWFFHSSLADNEKERKNGSIVLMSISGQEIKRWNFFSAFPCCWVGPKLVAGLGGSYAIERFEIVIEEVWGRFEEDEINANVQPAYFTQDQWEASFDKRFANNACAATSLLNEVSEEYTNRTGLAMTQEQGLTAMTAAVNNEAINREDATIRNWQNAETSMWESTGLPGSLTHNEGGGH